MAGKRSISRDLRLATPRQLWALNRAGKLLVVEDEELEPVSNAEADAAIKRSMGTPERAA